MQRFADQPLGNTPHIAVFGANKIGNFVVCTPLLNGLRKKYADAVIDYFGSEATKDFEERTEEIDFRTSWDANGDVLINLGAIVAERTRAHGAYQLAINLDGFNEVTQVLTAMIRPQYVAGGSFDARLRALLPWGEAPNQQFLAESDWDSADFLQRHQDEFSSNYIGELMCRMAYIETDYFALNLQIGEPQFNVPDILIHCTTTRAAKIWPMNNWLNVIRHCERRGLSVGLVGSPPAVQSAMYHGNGAEDRLIAETALIDLRGKTTLYELAGACKKAKATITVDAGPLHIAAAVGCATLAIFGNDVDGVGASPVRLWFPRMANVSRTHSSVHCDRCALNRFKNDACLRDRHECMYGVETKQVIEWIDENVT